MDSGELERLRAKYAENPQPFHDLVDRACRGNNYVGRHVALAVKPRDVLHRRRRDHRRAPDDGPPQWMGAEDRLAEQVGQSLMPLAT